ncbi:MAG: hypothetical protein RLY43_2346 [Bacteroidota bacterium]|jgi:hypothetical protein
MLYSYKAYKSAKKYTKDLETILKILNTSIRALNKYKNYKLVKEILKEMNIRKSLIDVYYKKYSSVLENKGIIDEENTKK